MRLASSNLPQESEMSEAPTLPVTLKQARERVRSFLDVTSHTDSEHRYWVTGGDLLHYNLYRADLKMLLEATDPALPDEVSPARRTDPLTSDRARRVAAFTARGSQGKLLVAFLKARDRGWDGLTSEGAVKMAGLGHQKAPWKRVSELKLSGLVEPTGETHKGSSGADAEILRITEKGVELTERRLAEQVAEMRRGL